MTFFDYVQKHAYDCASSRTTRSSSRSTNRALNVRDSVFQKYPKLADVINPLASALDTKTLQKLDSDVDEQADTPAQVATQFLKDHG